MTHKKHAAVAALSAVAALIASVGGSSAATPRPVGFKEAPGDAFLECSNRDILVDRNHISGRYVGRLDKWAFFVGGWARSSLAGEGFDVVARVRRNGETETIVSRRKIGDQIHSDSWIGQKIVIPGPKSQLQATKFHFVADGGARSQTVTLEDGYLYSSLNRGESRMFAIPYPQQGQTRFSGTVESAKAKGRDPTLKIQQRVRCAGRGQWETVHDFRLPGRRYNRTFDNPEGESRVYRAITSYAAKRGQLAKRVTISPPTAVGFESP